MHFLVVLTSESEIGIVSTSSENEALLLCRGAAVCRQLPQFLQPRKITNIFFLLSVRPLDNDVSYARLESDNVVVLTPPEKSKAYR